MRWLPYPIYRVTIAALFDLSGAANADRQRTAVAQNRTVDRRENNPPYDYEYHEENRNSYIKLWKNIIDRRGGAAAGVGTRRLG